MPSRPFAIAFLAVATLAASATAPVHAADLTISPKAGKQAAAQPGADKRTAAKPFRKGKASKVRRHDKASRRRIVTYNLYQDPVFKLNSALTGKRPLGAPHDLNRFGNLPILAVPVASAARPVSVSKAPTALKLPEPEPVGIDFGCRDKPFHNRPAKELTACYKHSVDRSWRTQTYLSHEFINGDQKWGGGMAVRYAY